MANTCLQIKSHHRLYFRPPLNMTVLICAFCSSVRDCKPVHFHLKTLKEVMAAMLHFVDQTLQ